MGAQYDPRSLCADEFINDEDLFFAKEDAAYPFANPRSREEAVRILEERIARNNRFVFAAVRGDYGDKLIAALDCAALFIHLNYGVSERFGGHILLHQHMAQSARAEGFGVEYLVAAAGGLGVRYKQCGLFKRDNFAQCI